MRKQWIAMLSLVALLVVGSVAGSAFAQTVDPADPDSATVSAERGDDSDGDAGASEGTDGDPSAEEILVEDGAKLGKERFVELLAANLGISVDDAQAALDATYEQLKEERRAAMEQAIRDALAKAVEAGKITQEEADAKLAEYLEDGDSGFRGGWFGKRGGHGGWHGDFDRGERGGWLGKRGGGAHGGWFGFGERTEGSDKNWDDSRYADEDADAA